MWLVSCGGYGVSADVGLPRCGSSELVVEQEQEQRPPLVPGLELKLQTLG